MHLSIVPFVDMAHIQSHESILDLSCGSAVVALLARIILGSDHGAIVGIDNSHSMLQEARRLWDTYGLADTITLHFGDVTH